MDAGGFAGDPNRVALAMAVSVSTRGFPSSCLLLTLVQETHEGGCGTLPRTPKVLAIRVATVLTTTTSASTHTSLGPLARLD